MASSTGQLPHIFKIKHVSRLISREVFGPKWECRYEGWMIVIHLPGGYLEEAEFNSLAGYD